MKFGTYIDLYNQSCLKRKQFTDSENKQNQFSQQKNFNSGCQCIYFKKEKSLKIVNNDILGFPLIFNMKKK